MFILALTLLSYLGEYGGIGVLGGFPVDLIVVAVFSLGMYFWAVHSGIRTEEVEAMVRSGGDQYV